MRQQEPGLSGPIGPIELVKHFPGELLATSGRVQWVGLEALRYRDQPPNEAFQPPLSHHKLLLFLHTPKELEARYEEISRVVPPPAGSILMVPAGTPAWYRWRSHSDSRVAAPAPPARPRHPSQDAVHEMAMQTSNLDPREGEVFTPRLLSYLVVSNSVDRATFENFDTLRGGR